MYKYILSKNNYFLKRVIYFAQGSFFLLYFFLIRQTIGRLYIIFFAIKITNKIYF